MIKKDTIQTIIETARVEEVVGDFVSLKRRGVNYIGLCPFHNEKTPSFTVSPSKGIYKCFGCGKAGNSVNFVMEHEHYSYPEALKYLADKYGIEVEEEQRSEEQQKQIDERESMFALNSFISKYFQQSLFESDEGQSVGLSYLKERSFLESTIKKFQLGYAFNQWEAYSEYALKNGYPKEVLVSTGLSIDKGDRLIDRFKGRVIFPIHNLTGKIIGFGGRILSSEKNTAKYLNSPESDIYNKSKSLYGIFFARNEIVKKDSCFLVEGYTDVISMHQAGIENVVASSGTSLTVDQIKLIKRYTPNITILYDGDTAGIKASFRGIDLILAQGMNVKIVLFPDGEDPDSYARSHTSTEMERFLSDEAADFITFKTRLLLQETKGDPVAKAALINEIVESISQIPDPIIRTVYIKECGAVMDLPEQTLMNALNRLIRERYKKQRNDYVAEEIPVQEEERFEHVKPKELDPYDTEEHESQLTRFMLLYGNEVIQVNEKILDEADQVQDVEREISVMEYIVENLDEDDIEFAVPVLQKILSHVKGFAAQHIAIDLSEFINHTDREVAEATANLLATPYELSENWQKNQIYVKLESDDLQQSIMAVLLSLRSKIIGKEMKKILDQMKATNDLSESEVLQNRYTFLKKVSADIDRELNRPFNY
ncbi:MAG: DNA primase [Bacteroidales bacterium]|nr:DNA primase [Bacteroidales bacterium]